MNNRRTIALIHPHRYGAFILAGLLQTVPLLKTAWNSGLLVSSTGGVVLRWVAVTAVTLGSIDAVSGGSPPTTIVSATTAKGTNGAPLIKYRILTSPYSANVFAATPLPKGVTLNSSGTISGTPTEDGVWQVNLTASDNGRADRTARAVLTLTIFPKAGPPVISKDPVSLTVNQGQPATFNALVTGNSPFTYQWEREGSSASVAVTSNLVFNAAASSDEGNYRVIVSNSSGSVTSKVASLTVIVPPTLQSAPVSQSVILGKPLSLSVTATGTAPLSFVWSFKGKLLAGVTSSTYDIAAITEAQGGEYSVRVSNASGFADVPPFVVTVLTPPMVSVTPPSLTVTAGDSAAFTSQSSGSDPRSYVWYFNNQPLDGQVGSVLNLASTTTAQTGDYKVKVTNPAGSAESLPVHLTVNEPVKVDVVLLSPSFTGGRLSFQVTGPQRGSYVIWSSSDMTAWLPVKTNAVVNGQTLYEEVTPDGTVARFYRVTTE